MALICESLGVEAERDDLHQSSIHYPRPFGASATTPTLSLYDSQAAPRSSPTGDHSSMDPSIATPFPGAAQIAHSQYPDFDNDDLSMPEHYPTAALQGNIADQLNDAAHDPSVNGQMGMSDTNKFDHNAPGMAPPQTPHQQAFPLGAARQSIDDVQLTGDGSKRKRSKVSRACDECRRKKVRCDAVAEDGTITTCQQCKKIHLTCEYSRVPMKRGPSKGYIKELSERVQQVESLQLQLSGQPGYRPSLDATSAIGGDLTYSPEDSMTRRAFSFSDPRNPFTQPEFSRDRLPSTGAWNTQSPNSTTFRPRDRGSLPVAPDQQGPTSFPILSKPFWESEYYTPPAKRRKLDDLANEPTTFSHDALTKYYENVHNSLPILPDADSAISIAQKSRPPFQQALLRSVDSLPFSKTLSHVNGQNGDTPSNRPSALTSLEDLESFVAEQAFEAPTVREDEENLVFVWTCLLLSVGSEFDLAHYTSGPNSAAVRLKAAADIILYLVGKDDEMRNRAEPNVEVRPISLSIHQALGCTALLVRLFSFSTASVDLIPAQQHITESSDWISRRASYLVRSAHSLAIVQAFVRDSPEPFPLTHSWYTAQKDVILHNHLAFEGKKDLEDTKLQQQLQYFFTLLLARYNRYAISPDNILQPALLLADTLQERATANVESYSYNPYDMHCFALTTMTLLELFYSPSDAETTPAIHDALGKIRKALEQKAELLHMAATSGGDRSQNGEQPSKHSTSRSWIDALLTLIEDRTKSPDVPNASDTQTMVDFGTLLRTGYMNVFLALVEA